MVWNLDNMKVLLIILLAAIAYFVFWDNIFPKKKYTPPKKKGPKKCGDCCYAEMCVYSTWDENYTHVKETWLCTKDRNLVEIHPRTNGCRYWSLTYKEEFIDKF